jgi:hypothetical protein
MTAAHFHLAGSIGKRSVYSSSAHSVCWVSQKVGTRTFGLEEQVMQRNTLISGTQMASQIGQIRDTLRKHQ